MQEFNSLAEAAEQVLFAQDACNGRAVMYMFPTVVQAITKFDPQSGTDEYNSHPLVVMMLDKLAQLAGGMVAWDGKMKFSDAYDWTLKVAKGEKT